MLKFSIFLALCAFVHANTSPHGLEYLNSLTKEQINGISTDILEDSLLDAVSINNPLILLITYFYKSLLS